jgi:molybdenum cofactor biosynthesis enzyme MoaA
MTPYQGVGLHTEMEKINWRNFKIGCIFAKDNNVSTVLFTGKGEPTLWPDQITSFLKKLKSYEFPIIELQTNGIILYQQNNLYKKLLKQWYDLGLTTIALSLIHYDNEKNKSIFQPNGQYMNVQKLIKQLHQIGYSVRMSCIMLNGYIDSIEELEKLITFCRENKVEQLSLRSLEKPRKSENSDVAEWVTNHRLDDQKTEIIKNFVKDKAVEVMRLVHGATVYDLDGQNICLTNALTIDPSNEEIRQLIFFPDGHLRYDWQYRGAILI